MQGSGQVGSLGKNKESAAFPGVLWKHQVALPSPPSMTYTVGRIKYTISSLFPFSDGETEVQSGS